MGALAYSQRRRKPEVSFTCLGEEWRKARKPHICVWCGQPILVGDRYKHVRGIFEGELQHNDWHPECDDACMAMCQAEGGPIEFSPGEFERPAQTVSGES